MTGRRVTPEGILLARYNTPREQWLRLRQQGIGGSDALAVMGLDGWKTRMEVWLDKTGRLPEKEATLRMVWGQFVEATIGEWFTYQTGIKVRRCGLLANVHRPWQRVSVDFLTADGGLLEIKNRSRYVTANWDDGQVDDGAEAQGQHGLAVTGLRHSWFAAQLAGEPPVIRRIERNDLLITDMNAMEAEFWQLVKDGTPPALEGRASPALVKRLFPGAETGKVIELDDEAIDLLRENRRVQREEATAKRSKEELAAKVQMLIGDAEFATHRGRLVATWKATAGRENTDSELLKEKYPAVAAEVVTRTPGRMFLNKLGNKDLQGDGTARKEAA